VGGFLQELVNVGLYKKSQGRITRQVTFFAMLICIAAGCYRLYTQMFFWWDVTTWYGVNYWLPGVLLLAGGWISYRIVNVPSVADFLIAVEAEMNKVSWPTRTELFRASSVVLFCIIALAVLIYIFDFVFSSLIHRLFLG
jgi:preprotein translocase subunit SecE